MIPPFVWNGLSVFWNRTWIRVSSIIMRKPKAVWTVVEESSCCWLRQIEEKHGIVSDFILNPVFTDNDGIILFLLCSCLHLNPRFYFSGFYWIVVFIYIYFLFLCFSPLSIIKRFYFAVCKFFSFLKTIVKINRDPQKIWFPVHNDSIYNSWYPNYREKRVLLFDFDLSSNIDTTS